MLFFLVFTSFLIFSAFVFQKYRAKSVKNKNKATNTEVLNNKYIIDHEKKIEDDKIYDEYLEWCKIKGELPVEKNGFDKHRMEEYYLYKKIMKHGISGIKNHIK